MMQLQTPEAGKEMMLDALPGGHQIVADGMPQPLKDCLGRGPRCADRQQSGHYCADFQALNIGADDIVVSFNNCIPAPLLSRKASMCSFMGSMHQTPTFSAFLMGLGCSGFSNSRVSVVSRCWWGVLRRSVPCREWPSNGSGFHCRRCGTTRWTDREKTLCRPSTGFNALVLFDWLRGHAGYTYQLMTLGFPMKQENSGAVMRGLMSRIGWKSRTSPSFHYSVAPGGKYCFVANESCVVYGCRRGESGLTLIFKGVGEC
jgi:hypothetical protein